MKISIVMPSRNQGRFISRAVDSVLSQYQDGNLELIVQDCMSTDCTAEVLSKYSHPALIVHRQMDSGQSDAIGRGFSNSTGEILSWLNSDDVLRAGAVDHVLAAYAGNPGIDVVFGDACYIDEQDRILGYYPTSKPATNRLKHRCVISQPSVFFRRDAYFSSGGVNPNRHYCMDYELWTKFAIDKRTFHRVDPVLSCTRVHAYTKTSNGGLPFIEEICRMQQEQLGEVSPIWRVYQMARSSELAHVDRKIVRFLAASVRIASTQPASIPILAYAGLERACAEIIARIKLWQSKRTAT